MSEPFPLPTADRPEVAIFANPFSGHRDNRPPVHAVADALSGRGLTPRLLWTPDELDAFHHDPALHHCRAIVACGGDGTLHRVINHRLPLPLAPFPLGTANLMAGHFHHTRDPDRLAAALAAPRGRTIDLGRAGDRWFSVVASAGFDGAVAHCLADWRRRDRAGRPTASLRRVSHLSYPRHILAVARRCDFPMIRMETDRGHRLRAALVMVFNLPRYAFNFHLCDHAQDDDGELDWLAFQNPGLLPLARYALHLLLRRHLKLPDIQHGRCRALHLTADDPARPVPLELDGEPAGFTPCPITLHPAALTVVLPA
jgi:diacylglycerol kinase family enzyme